MRFTVSGVSEALPWRRGNGPREIDITADSITIPMGLESECLQIKLIEPDEIVVLRCGMNYPEGGEAVYSEPLEQPQ